MRLRILKERFYSVFLLLEDCDYTKGLVRVDFTFKENETLPNSGLWLVCSNQLTNQIKYLILFFTIIIEETSIIYRQTNVFRIFFPFHLVLLKSITLELFYILKFLVRLKICKIKMLTADCNVGTLYKYIRKLTKTE